MDRQNFFQDFQHRLLELFRASPAADLERNVKAFMAQSFNRLELVTRDEFEAQREMLRELSDRVAALESTAFSDSSGSAAAPDAYGPDAFGPGETGSMADPAAPDTSPSESSPYDPPRSGTSGYGAPPAIDPRGSA